MATKPRVEYPKFGARTLPETAIEFTRAVLPALLQNHGPATVSEIVEELDTLCTKTYRRVIDGYAQFNTPVSRSTVARALRSVKGVVSVHGHRGADNSGKQVRYNFPTSPVAAIVAAAPPKPVEDPKPVEAPMPSTPADSGMCQSTRSIWALPASRCVWGDAQYWDVTRKQAMVRTIQSVVPNWPLASAASRIRRDAIKRDPSISKMTRANVGAVLIHLMREGKTALICRHNPSRKRRLNYLWHRM